MFTVHCSRSVGGSRMEKAEAEDVPRVYIGSAVSGVHIGTRGHALVAERHSSAEMCQI